MLDIGKEYRYLYVHIKTDIDGSVYEHTLEDNVRLCDIPSINEVIKYYAKKYDDGYYIRYNRLYFIYKGIRYWTIPSCRSGEYMFIRKLIQHLSNLGCTCFYYNCGRED